MEISCGGTVSRYIDEGNEVYCVVFSFAEKSIPDVFPITATKYEYKKSLEVLNVKDVPLSVSYSTRDFDRNRHLILDDMIHINKHIQPDIVMLPNSSDVHQDHQVIHQEGIRAFRNTTLLGYDNIWNTVQNNPYNFYVKLTCDNMNSKIMALDNYKSQLHKNPSLLEDVMTIARTRGMTIDYKYAESFEVIRIIL